MDFQFKKMNKISVTPLAVDRHGQIITTQEMTHLVDIKSKDVPQLTGNAPVFTITDVRTIPEKIPPNYMGLQQV